MLTAAIAIVIVLSGKSKREPFRGILVCKEYIPAHWDDVRVETMQEAYVPVPVPIAPIIAANSAARNSSMARSYVPSRWIYYVANKHEVRDYYVDSLTYVRHNVCDRLIIK